MKLRELQQVVHPLQKIKVIYRDPTRSLETSVVFEGWFKMCTDNVILGSNVVVVRSVCNIMYIEVF